jgi:hypothetical protein
MSAPQKLRCDRPPPNTLVTSTCKRSPLLMSPCHQGEHLWRPRQRIEAVSKGIRDYVAAIEVGSNGDRTPDPMADSVMLACAALEAAERVRAEALPAKQDDAERARRYRARKRDGRAGFEAFRLVLASLSVLVHKHEGHCGPALMFVTRVGSRSASASRQNGNAIPIARRASAPSRF